MMITFMGYHNPVYDLIKEFGYNSIYNQIVFHSLIKETSKPFKSPALLSSPVRFKSIKYKCWL